MAAELQQLVESLAHRLGRSVAIDDRALRLLAHSSHTGPVDDVRTQSIMTRQVPQPLIDLVRQSGTAEAHGIFTVPGNRVAGLKIGRIGAPIRYQGVLQGYVWLLESEGSLSQEEVETVRGAADAASIILQRAHLASASSRRRETELVVDVLGEDEAARDRAAGTLVGEGRFAPGPVVVLVAMLERQAPLTDQDRLAITTAAELGRMSRARGEVLVLEQSEQIVLLLSASVHQSDSYARLGGHLRERLLKEASTGATAWVGISDPSPSLAEATGAYADARRTAVVAGSVGTLGHVVHQDDLNVYGLLAEVPPQHLARSLHPGVRRLLERGSDGQDALAETLETFLDSGCDVKFTTEQLHVHRATLYYRLNRAREVTGLDHNDGIHRLTLHLGFKIARLLGDPPSAPGAHDRPEPAPHSETE